MLNSTIEVVALSILTRVGPAKTLPTCRSLTRFALMRGLTSWSKGSDSDHEPRIRETRKRAVKRSGK